MRLYTKWRTSPSKQGQEINTTEGIVKCFSLEVLTTGTPTVPLDS